jgi:hypothetical protein
VPAVIIECDTGGVLPQFNPAVDETWLLWCAGGGADCDLGWGGGFDGDIDIWLFRGEVDGGVGP